MVAANCSRSGMVKVRKGNIELVTRHRFVIVITFGKGTAVSLFMTDDRKIGMNSFTLGSLYEAPTP